MQERTAAGGFSWNHFAAAAGRSSRAARLRVLREPHSRSGIHGVLDCPRRDLLDQSNSTFRRQFLFQIWNEACAERPELVRSIGGFASGLGRGRVGEDRAADAFVDHRRRPGWVVAARGENALQG